MMPASLRQPIYSLLRFAIVLALAVMGAGYLNSRNYTDYFNKTLVKIHADANLGVDAGELARLLVNHEYGRLQQQLDRNYNVYALMITDCKTEEELCPGQQLLFATTPRLYGKQGFRLDRLNEFPFVVLRKPQSTSVFDLLSPEGKRPARKGEIIGRVYSISTVPTFAEDYRRWLGDPLRHNELWRTYLITMAVSLSGGGIIWLMVELFLKMRRNDRLGAARREAALMERVATYLRRLEENESRITERERHYSDQFEAYVVRIRDLEKRIADVSHYRDISAAIIAELEAERNRQSDRFREELERTNAEKMSLQKEFENYRSASAKDKAAASRALDQAINPRFANPFEKQIFASLTGSPAAVRGEWLVVPHLDVAGGKATSKVIDFVVISKNCLIVLETKNYWGVVTATGDTVNSRWQCTDSASRALEVKSSWGVNPYHQVREYAMSLMNMVQQQKQWKLSVYGLVVFPDTADISAIDERIGKYYRVVRAARLVTVLESIDAEARRENAFGKRPTPAQLEDLLRGVS